jgi:hypothetical protein
VRGAALGHRQLRERLEQMRASLEQGSLEEAERASALLLDLLRRHESEEDQIVSRLAHALPA